jgi:hypothetical protein
VAVCEPGALTSVADTEGRTAEARRAWRLWETLPDASGSTISRVAKHEGVGFPAAVLLSRHCRFTMSGADGAEAGSGEKTAVRLALATAEFHLQPLMAEQLEALGKLQENLAQHIRDMLASALPTEDLDRLALGIRALGREDVDLASLAGKLEEACETRRIDASASTRHGLAGSWNPRGASPICAGGWSAGPRDWDAPGPRWR